LADDARSAHDGFWAWRRRRTDASPSP
jgi:hypothetical protein